MKAKLSFSTFSRVLLCVAAFGMPAAQATPTQSSAAATVQGKDSGGMAGPDLDLTLGYYSRVMTSEGVLREQRYEEKMLRRAGHVWVARVLPKTPAGAHAEKAATGNHRHDFNYVVMPRHIVSEGAHLRFELVDLENRALIAIAPAEYENVNFDGSWENAFFLIDPRAIAKLPLATQDSGRDAARWHAREQGGQFQRVLWDEKRLIPLVIETGDKAGTFFRRIDIKPQPGLTSDLPWQSTKTYAQKEYADFLD